MECVLNENFPNLNGLIDINLLNKTLEFVIESTKCFDSSHNWEHALAVAINVIKIASHEFNADTHIFIVPQIVDIILIALLHDVCDHKYPDAIPMSELENYCISIDMDHKMYMEIINNVSWSKERKGLRKTFNSYWTTILNIVSDADRIEAIGKVGIDRCTAYALAIGGDVPSDVIIHYHEKLRLLYDENYIRTNYGRILALPHHLEMKEIIEQMVLSQA
jgi:uncharacterized protein